ncbi:hypothetical protein CRG98_019974 [Punica granatum]|uniref:Uncharacterized protein n=1 Tax=Punica granatum TaxID=22663 RepID=A0A2I0JTI8_PUNGR|nr:hypothetical protein CRG98_019974 [Punica granatum]
METGGGADRMCSEDRKVVGGRGTAVGADDGGSWVVKGWTADVCSVGSAGASIFSGAWVGGAHGVGSTVGPVPQCGLGCRWRRKLVRPVADVPLKMPGVGDVLEGRLSTPGACLQEWEAAEHVLEVVEKRSGPVG